MTTEQKISAAKMLQRLEFAEVDGRLKGHPDYRRLLTDERVALADALRSGDRSRIVARMAEARRVVDMWTPVVGIDVLA